MEFFDNFDLFAQPVSQVISLKKERKVHTRCSIICMFSFYFMLVLAVGVSFANMAGFDDYVYENFVIVSTAWKS